MGDSTTFWFIFLIVFNGLLLVFVGLLGGTFADIETVEAVENNPLIPDFALSLVVGFASFPAWLNSVFAIQGAIAIYLLIALIRGV